MDLETFKTALSQYRALPAESSAEVFPALTEALRWISKADSAHEVSGRILNLLASLEIESGEFALLRQEFLKLRGRN